MIDSFLTLASAINQFRGNQLKGQALVANAMRIFFFRIVTKKRKTFKTKHAREEEKSEKIERRRNLDRMIWLSR
ncbi:MAG: hypothetical protein LBQ50_09360 [Planctomycetaceae bacterium]|nr:hypothetical protein [Planctomycetaceae bacterium]